MDIKNIYFLLLFASLASSLLPLFFSILYYKAFNTQLKALFIYLLCSLLTEIVSLVLSYKKINNAVLFHLFTIAEFLLILLIYKKEFDLKKFRSLFAVVAVIFVAIACFGFSIHDPNTLATSIESVVMMVLSIAYFYKVFTDQQIPKLARYYFFWLNSAFLIYFTVPFFLLLFESFVRDSNQIVTNFLWAIQLVTNIIFNILLTIGICKIKRT